MHSYRVALTTKAMMFTAAIFSMNSNASVMVTPFIGYSLGGAAETADSTSYDISPSANLALAVEFPFRNAEWALSIQGKTHHLIR